MSALCVVRSGGSKHPCITWTCDSCGTTETAFGPDGWNGPARWITRLTPSDLVRNLCGLCAATNEAKPGRRAMTRLLRHTTGS